ncbi:16S rRNA (cytidine1402-2'-O)-methyltransferase [Paracoccus isoporae]|uniref:Ribosomal RNA small subunit methyltransferase I n=1 Tax=Paracoccus isoporae TaxID=591205 RepID=A0A1G7GNB0_9RHOB|nr:16S rRNA (cytidine(1402)-2'-O)-methyltransferase [Paracoccus isoporae]SDE89602.1 16S rRNA (cytidine1402-2'-O)-methyltransferase [Paracoccus isoporae]
MTEQTDEPQPRPARIESDPLGPGLYLVATPIGAARDITLRALDVLNAADHLAAEDTRTLRHLMDIHGIPLRGRRILACHDHNENRQSAAVAAAVAEGRSVAYCSDAGTPLVADPGYRLARAVIAEGGKVIAVPGASAVLAALSVSGLPSDRFIFAGFAPQPAGARRKWLSHLSAQDATAILFESPRRIKQTLGILCEIAPDRHMVMCRELTKKFEETLRGTAAEILAQLPEAGPKGEIVLMLDRPDMTAPADPAEFDSELRRLLENLSLRDAAAEIAQRYGIARRKAYQMALAITNTSSDRKE